ncbi:MAG: cell surface protein SprA, partial [Bacteroidota bacterium]
GNVSEDILRDSRKFFENGLPRDPSRRAAELVETDWGKVPTSLQIVDAFDNDPEARAAQDLGLDGMDNAEEADHYESWLSSLEGFITPNALENIRQDPSNDDFRFYLDFPEGTPVRESYTQFNKTQGNSRIASGNDIRPPSSTIQPDNEDLNNDQTLSETESYFQYRIPLRRKEVNGRNIGLSDGGQNYITDERIIGDGSGGIQRIWYRLRIPLDVQATSADPSSNPNARGGIQDFRSIRFVRMYLTGFEQPVTLRFARLDLVRNQWRSYEKDLENLVADGQADATEFDITAINIEENGERLPFNYVLPEGIQREQNIGAFTALQNEQSLALTVRNLRHEDSRSIFKNINFDMRNYERMKMFVHAERLLDSMGIETCAMGETPEEGDLSMFIRLGSDFKENFYEYEMPLTFSNYDPMNTPGLGEAPTSAYRQEVWRQENSLDVDLQWFVEAKKVILNALQTGQLTQDSLSFPNTIVPIDQQNILQQIPPGHRLFVKGRPNLGFVKSVLIGVRNTSSNASTHCGEIWINELRLTGLNEQGGYAAQARMDVQLADFGSISASTSYNSVGFGALDQRLEERALDETLTYDMAMSLELGKFLPQQSGIRVPFYAAYTNTTVTPKFDPYDLDIELDDKLAAAQSNEQRQEIKEQAQEVTTVTNYSFTNVRKERTSKPKKNGKPRKPMPWDISNFNATYSYTEEERSDPFIESNKTENWRGILDYTYTRRPNYIKPFKKLPKNEWIKFLRDMNFNPLPNTFNFSSALDRRLETTSYRFTEEFAERYQTYLNKQFTWNRQYGLTWDFSKALKINFDANYYGIIDEFDEMSDTFFEESELSQGQLEDARREAILKGLESGGRAQNYDHNLGINFTVPTKLFPFLDWTSIRAQYQGDYAWTAARKEEDLENLGNIIQNGQKRQLTADFNFDKLYNKSNYLKQINRPKRSGGGRNPRTSPQGGKEGEKLKRDEKKKKRDKKRAPSNAERAIIRPLMVLRKARLNYSEQFSTIVPGFMPEANLLGMDIDSGFEAPGWDFVAGLQPTIRTASDEVGSGWLNAISNERVANGEDSWISGDVFQNQPVIQQYTQTIDARVSLEPIPDFRIDVDASRNYTENYSEFFKTESQMDSTTWKRSVRNSMGSLDLTYYSLQTLFNDDLEEIVARFQRFRAARAELSSGFRQLSEQYRTADGEPIFDKEGQYILHPSSLPEVTGPYYFGFGRGQQDVLLPAFLAIYTGKDIDPEDAEINSGANNIFNQLPLPNWRIQYNGLAKVPFFEDIFQQVSLSHAYTSKLTMNTFRTNLDYVANPTADEARGINDDSNYFSRLEIPELTIREGFSPLIGLKVQTLNDISLSLDVNKTRTLSTDFQNGFLSEQQAFDITFGFGWLLEDVNIAFLQNIVQKASSQTDKVKDKVSQTTPFGGRGGGGGGANPGDFNINFDFSLRDDVTFVYELESNREPEPTRGTRAISIAPSLEYQLHEQLALRLFVDYSRTVPKISRAFPITSARGGVIIRFLLQ